MGKKNEKEKSKKDEIVKQTYLGIHLRVYRDRSFSRGGGESVLFRRMEHGGIF